MSKEEIIEKLLADRIIVNINQNYIFTEKYNKITEEVSANELEMYFLKLYNTVPYRVNSFDGKQRTIRTRWNNDTRIFKLKIYDKLKKLAKISSLSFDDLFNNFLTQVKIYYQTESSPFGLPRLVKDEPIPITLENLNGNRKNTKDAFET